MEAQKLKKKLNGTTLKGQKVKIEEAKPERKRSTNDTAVEDDTRARKRAKKESRKKEEGVLSGHQLEEGRYVKRGWTDGADAKREKKASKKARKEAEASFVPLESRKLRYRTSVPTDALTPEQAVKSKKKSWDSKDSDDSKKREKWVLEEFKNTKKLNSGEDLQNESKHGLVSYVEGEGWVDDGGQVVESERPSKRPKRKHREPSPQATKSTSEEAPDVPGNHAKGAVPDATGTADQEEDSEDSDMQVDEAHGQAHADNAAGHDATTFTRDFASPSQVSPTDQAGTVDDAETQEKEDAAPKEVHPLEALFKRPVSSASDSKKPKPGRIDTSFSFFGGEDADVADEQLGGGSAVPQTPHTSQDLRWRGRRSAAPTPDTAAIGRHFSFPFARDLDEDEDEELDDEDDDDVDHNDENDQVESGATYHHDSAVEQEELKSTASASKDAEVPERGEESAFRKWFYENRGDLNRGWKKRRREERKAKRQQENRRLNRTIA